MIWRASKKKQAIEPEGPVTVDLRGRQVELQVRRNHRARRINLRIDPSAGGAVLTLPLDAPLEEGIGLARQKAHWLISRLDALPPHIPFTDGAEVPVLGRPHRVRHLPGRRGVVRSEDGELLVSGRPEHLSRRLVDWLRQEAKRQIVPRAEAKAALIDRRVGRITVRDTRSRWGSCSANGNLSFCWRLVMTPEDVLDYVVAHEVAHLKYRSHGPRFWQTAGKLTRDMEEARAWLLQHGETLHRYG